MEKKDFYFKKEIKGKEIKIPMKEIDTLKHQLEDLTTDEAINLWLCDHDYISNEEQEALNTIAKAHKTTPNAKSGKPRKTPTRERKANPDKEIIIATLANTLKSIATDINIENIGKIITFSMNNKQFKLDLTEKRIKKDEK